MVPTWSSNTRSNNPIKITRVETSKTKVAGANKTKENGVNQTKEDGVNQTKEDGGNQIREDGAKIKVVMIGEIMVVGV